MLDHAGSAEINLKRLESAGQIGVKEADMKGLQETVDETEKKIETGEEKQDDDDHMMGGRKKPHLLDPMWELGKGKIKLVLQEICMETAWEKYRDDHPGAEVIPYAMMSWGALLLVLVQDDEIVCPYGRTTINGGEPKYIPLCDFNLK